MQRTSIVPALLACALATQATRLPAQDRLKSMPGYDRFTQMSREIPNAVKSGALAVTWDADGSGFRYQRDGKSWRYAVATRSAVEAPAAAATGARRGGPERGRQFDVAWAADSSHRAFYRDRNVWLANRDGSGEVAITTDGNETARTKNGSASWVYGEELGQVTAMWWSPDGSKLAFYRFDESPVTDYVLQMAQTKVHGAVDVEAYPKAGDPNPVVELMVYDVATRRTTRIDVRDGKPFTNDVVGHYVYRVGWTPDGSELTFNRTNRRQNVMEFTACRPDTGACRVIVREEWPASWVRNSPQMRYLADGKRFLWMSERTGFANLYLYDLTGKLHGAVTRHPFEVDQLVSVDEKAGTLLYTARSGDNHMKVQLHRVRLDGRDDVRLTDPAFNHTVAVSPTGQYIVDVAQTHDIAPVTRLLDARGKVVAELATSDLTKFDQLGLRRVEMFTYKAADGVTELHGMLHRPSTFDSTRAYPVLVTVYAGPATNGARETFTTPHPFTEYGFIVLSLDSRSAAGRGKAFLDAIYQKLGTVEIDDQAAGVRSLWNRRYIDKARVGIFGTSYGGYASAMALLRHPDVFAAGSAMSAVTDWRHYDTIYTERYMWIPQENTAGYDAGSAMPYADKLKGRLMIYYGTADNNVHPNNSMQLIQALQRAGKSFEVQVGPDQGHTPLRPDRMMEFFIENLVLRAPVAQ
ncbi:MAG: DPP IV N-terminal domain-containing protein [Gemmatimonadaceae bacterium]|nr:DPP IV N-terminal domain-containing protein [Gemmatimonadaceae bacterium]